VSPENVPAAVAKLVREHINAVEQLEILLLLQGNPKEWTALAVSEQIRTGLESARARLVDLEARGFVVRTGDSEPTFRYAPADRTLEPVVAALAKTYAEKRYTIINLIFSKPVDKIRVFADAFKLRNDEDDDG
jgi:hypothetical protein